MKIYPINSTIKVVGKLIYNPKPNFLREASVSASRDQRAKNSSPSFFCASHNVRSNTRIMIQFPRIPAEIPLSQIESISVLENRIDNPLLLLLS